MQIDVVLVPQLLTPRHVTGRAVVVLDVLRATTTMVAALDAGAREIRVFRSIDEVRAAASPERTSLLLCGEEKCLCPTGFDLGNSPAEFTRERVAGRTILMSTTNGTRALVAARGAGALFAAALVNAEATAGHLARLQRDVTLLCAGTAGELSMEDAIGAGAIVCELIRLISNKTTSDAARVALATFKASENFLPQTLRETLGGRNVMAAGLDADINFAARLNVSDTVATVDPDALIVTRAAGV